MVRQNAGLCDHRIEVPVSFETVVQELFSGSAPISQVKSSCAASLSLLPPSAFKGSGGYFRPILITQHHLPILRLQVS